MRVRMVLLPALLLLTACTNGPTESHEEGQPTPPTTPPTSERLMSPEVQSGYQEILNEGPRRGNWEFGTVRLPAGESWININCVSDDQTADVQLIVHDVGAFTVGCSEERVEKNANQFTFRVKRKARISIDASEKARWTVSVQVPTRSE